MTRNLGDLILGASDTYGDAVAYQVKRGFRMERLTFREVTERTRRVAGWLSARGMVPGDRLVVWSGNMPEYAVLYFGAWLAGLVMVPIDVRTKQNVLDRFVTSAGPRFGFKSRFLEGQFGPPVEQTFVIEDLFVLVADSRPLAPLPRVSPDSLCEIAFTSGTTGVPKGVLLTHANFVAEIEALQVAFPLDPRYRALSLLPLSHAFEQAINLLLAFCSGVRMTYVPRANTVTIARALREERITCFVLVPELLRMILAGLERRVQREGQWARWQMAHRLAQRLPFPLRRLLFRKVHQALGGCLDFIACGSAPLDVKLASTWERMGIHIFEGYGLTEVAGGATLNNRVHKRLGSVGKPIPGIEMKLADDGEILIRGATVTPGYHENPDLTARSFTADGWFRTGDVGSFDPDGFLHISGREAFRIVLADGRKVYPEDVEQTLDSHPLVRQSCVVGPKRDGGETVHAVLLTDAPERAGEIIRETNRALSAHEQIASFTVWADEDFPRTPILKVDRKLVRAAVEQHLASAVSVRPRETAAWADPLVALVGRIADRPPADVRDDSELGIDLRLDSIGRIELLSAIEEELGVVVDELQVGPQTTVEDLRGLVGEGASTQTGSPRLRWPRSWWARLLRPLLLWIGFRIQDRWLEIEVVHPERAATLPVPSLLIFNYQGPYVPLAMLRALPAHVRSQVAIAADARLWEGKDRWQGWLLALAAQAFPFVKSGGAVRPSLEELGRWLDDGYAVIMSPEGNPERNGELLPFLGGTGLMAVEMRVPVVSFKIENYYPLFPTDPAFPYLPTRRGRVRLIIGEPATFPKTMDYQTATERARQALIDTR